MGNPRADEMFEFSFAQGMSTFQRVEVFHRNMKLPLNFDPVTPSVSDRLLRGRLMLEEFMEFLEQGLGLRLCHKAGGRLDSDELDVIHVEGDRYDPVMTLDGICDMKVIADGTGVAFGLPVDQADWEVFCSNMSKLDENGDPIINGVTPGYRGPEITEGGHHTRLMESGFRADLPVGKLLKSDNYTPANLVRVIVEAQPADKEPATLNWLLNQGELP